MRRALRLIIIFLFLLIGVLIAYVFFRDCFKEPRQTLQITLNTDSGYADIQDGKLVSRETKESLPGWDEFAAQYGIADLRYNIGVDPCCFNFEIDDPEQKAAAAQQLLTLPYVKYVDSPLAFLGGAADEHKSTAITGAVCVQLEKNINNLLDRFGWGCHCL